MMWLHMKPQIETCAKYGANYVPAPSHLKAGVARNVKDGLLPINGLRLQPEEGTTGWFIWAGGEMSQDPDFFVPLHVSHLDEWSARVMRFLGLPPGWRFLVANDYEDVWEDKSLLDQ
jgi:hypothetical protein